MTAQDIAIAHKDYDVRGGGEVLAEELAQTFDAPMFVGRRDPSVEPEHCELDIQEISHGRLAKMAIDHGGASRSAAYQLTWQNVPELEDYSTIITSGNEPLWYVPRDDQTVIAYTHSPPRWQYDLFNDIDHLPGIAYNYLTRVLYQHNVTRPDIYVANSDLVARRIRQYWNIPDDQIRVVYPPVKTHEYSPSDAETRDYYVTVSRLDGPKRIGEIVEAFNQLGDDYQLRVAGRGPERDRLEELAEDNVHFEGYVSEERKQNLLAGAKAFVFNAQNEDFGMAPVEAMAAGTPVIGVNDGFTRFQIIDGENGLLFDRDHDGDLREMVKHLDQDRVGWTDSRIAEFASRFSVEEFRAGMRDAVEDAHERSHIQPEWMAEDAVLDGEAPPKVRADGGESDGN